MRYLVRKGVIKLLASVKAKHNKYINADHKKRARFKGVMMLFHWSSRYDGK